MKKIIFLFLFLVSLPAFAELWDDIEPIPVQLITDIQQVGGGNILGNWIVVYSNFEDCESEAVFEEFLRTKGILEQILIGEVAVAGRPSASQRIQLASFALSQNANEFYTALFAKYQMKLNALRMTQDSTSEEMETANTTITEMKTRLDRVRGGASISKEYVDSKMSELQNLANESKKKVDEQSLQITQLKNEIKNAASQKEVSSLSALLSKSIDLLKQSSAEFSAARKATDEMRRAVVDLGDMVVGVDSPAIGGLTNTLASITKYLGYDANEVESADDKNKGLTFVAPFTRDGKTADNILNYLDSFGMLALLPYSETTSGNQFRPRKYLYETSDGKVYSTFGVPENWVDGNSLEVVDGKIKANLAGVWGYDGSKFIGCACMVGSKNLTKSEIPWSAVGDVYAHIDVSVAGSPTLSLSETGGEGSDTLFIEWVGAIAEKTVTGTNGVASTVRYLSARRDSSIQILCYE